jgi:hypothetical protein
MWVFKKYLFHLASSCEIGIGSHFCTKKYFVFQRDHSTDKMSQYHFDCGLVDLQFGSLYECRSLTEMMTNRVVKLSRLCKSCREACRDSDSLPG